MRKLLLIFLTLLLLLLSSCAPSEEDGTRLTEHLASLDSFTAEVLVTAEFSDRTSSFRLKTAVSGETGTVEVLEPAELSGITVAIEPSGCTVSYDGASFEAGDAAALSVSPVTAAAELARLWRSAAPRESGIETLNERECILLVYASGTDETRVWFDMTDLSPRLAEFYRDGKRSLGCEFVSFTIGGS